MFISVRLFCFLLNRNSLSSLTNIYKIINRIYIAHLFVKLNVEQISIYDTVLIHDLNKITHLLLCTAMLDIEQKFR